MRNNSFDGSLQNINVFLFRYLVLDIADTTSENIIQHFQQVKDFIDEGLNSGGKILVHGNAGISRSAALVLAYMMEKYNYTRSYVSIYFIYLFFYLLINLVI